MPVIGPASHKLRASSFSFSKDFYSASAYCGLKTGIAKLSPNWEYPCLECDFSALWSGCLRVASLLPTAKSGHHTLPRAIICEPAHEEAKTSSRNGDEYLLAIPVRRWPSHVFLRRSRSTIGCRARPYEQESVHWNSAIADHRSMDLDRPRG